MRSTPSYSLGLDYGTNSVRCLIARCRDGLEVATHVHGYEHGHAGILLDSQDPNLARQHPGDYLTGAVAAVRGALKAAAESEPGFDPTRIVGIGVDTTGSTPIPLDASGHALAEDRRFAGNPHAMAWLWKDHTSLNEAAAITQAAAKKRPAYLRTCGGVYSSEWFWSKIWHCATVAPRVSAAAATWMECADWVPAMLTGTEASAARGFCAAGHKALYHPSWGGYPDARFLRALHPELARIGESLRKARMTDISGLAGTLTAAWADQLGLPAGLPVAAGAIDAHLGAVGSGVKPGRLVKILGTSTCDIMVAPATPGIPFIPGLCGVVPGSVLPGHIGLEAGQSAVGDLFNWWVDIVKPGNLGHEQLTNLAAELRPGESGLLALDWNNGNRNILVDPLLTGLLVGQTLQTRPEEIYRALIEATAFGARMIIERLTRHGVAVKEVVNCGGIAEKNPMVLQIYADVLGRPMRLARSSQACALGAAIAGAVAGKAHPDFPSAQKAMTGVKPGQHRPKRAAAAVYDTLFELYRELHDAFGTTTWKGRLHPVMKQLITLRQQSRKHAPRPGSR